MDTTNMNYPHSMHSILINTQLILVYGDIRSGSDFKLDEHFVLRILLILDYATFPLFMLGNFISCLLKMA
jgi:hypothetical protein